MSALKTLLLYACVLMLANVPGWSQRAAELAGIATDSSGQVIPGIQVNATNQETGVKLSTVTNDAGAYRFVELVAAVLEAHRVVVGYPALLVQA